MEETEDFTTEVTELTENNFLVFSPLTPLALWWHTLLPLPTPFTLQPRDLDQLGCHSFDVFLHRELREDVFERGGGHELPQPGRRVVGHDAAGAQDDDARAELFDRLELVRTVEDDATARSTSAVPTSRPDTGSSRMISRGLWMRAAESRIFCRMPFEKEDSVAW